MMSALRWVLAALPLAAFLATLLLAGFAAFVVGHWPYYAHPDPAELPLPGALAAVAALFLGAVGSMFVFPTVTAWCAWRRSRPWSDHDNPWHRPMLVFMLGVSLWIAETLIRGGGGLIAWLMD